MKKLGIDIGGANTKIASSDGAVCELHYVPLWKETKLPTVLKNISKKHNPSHVGVVMTGELADCYEDKTAGVVGIMDIVRDSFDCEIDFLDQEGNFIKHTQNPASLAAANWMASASFIARKMKDCLFVDMGSTTSDLIPVKNGKVIAHNTDTQRLANNELLYQGILRTNIAALLDSVAIRPGNCQVASELFATSADAYLLLSYIDEDAYTCETADGHGKSEKEAARRLARVVCADLNEIDMADVRKIAVAVKDRQKEKLSEAISELCHKHDINIVLAAGLGEFLIKTTCEELGIECISLAEKWSLDVSKVFPAYAVANLLE
ncbi:hypothetical protein C7960_1714 [Methanohalophilus euhalobius]|uniref:Hydantoinase A/oxoprolinase domain-containing protein n=1 Tax=Methanohalophilus euhalobius TaxID=51203 RepID=A0A285G6S1_9EURY|nr:MULTISPECIES: hydantoinase/oxoprolinase family protein [Methanohalophilus]ODV49304.1 MAG: H4MPT-linked C1 transfer pathway protein [Methanohalophilus sp. 2-GBenrich]RSD35266.1 MAG: H4MPT-linked C1 transfer pathway protein [Methanohalophilus sp.]TCL12455.1 hypothetical protein C7960_1714 [Methanohalophilus euhalobius]SNY19290.1 hypothetical protein SAMN06295989_10958 [Methanohalophilus euhalobius]